MDLGHHAEACTRLLAGAPAAVGAWDAGCLDEEMSEVRDTFLATAQHPDVRVITISCTHKFNRPFFYTDYYDLAQPVILKAAGNKSDDWLGFRASESLSGDLYTPGYMRVGEARETGKVTNNSQVSGPAFICDHPRDMKAIMGDGHYVATEEDVSNFLAWPYHDMLCESRVQTLLAYKTPSCIVSEFLGTSASAPYAGSLIMRHTLNMKGITSYDILPAVLMAAQMKEPPPEAVRSVETQSGMIFDPFHYGHGTLVEKRLVETLCSIWNVRSKGGKATQAGDYSQPLIVEGRGHMSARTDKAQGPVVNVILQLSFENDEMNQSQTEARIPEFVLLRSPQGTFIHLPIVYDRKFQYGPCVLGGYQTAAFFGEDISKGHWEVRYSRNDKNPLRISSIKVIAHTMHPKSPALVYFRAFQRSLDIERAIPPSGP